MSSVKDENRFFFSFVHKDSLCCLRQIPWQLATFDLIFALTTFSSRVVFKKADCFRHNAFVSGHPPPTHPIVYQSPSKAEFEAVCNWEKCIGHKTTEICIPFLHIIHLIVAHCAQFVYIALSAFQCTFCNGAGRGQKKVFKGTFDYFLALSNR